QSLSHRLGADLGGGDGVCANIDFPFPGTLVNEATAQACGFARDTDPWPPERSVWPLVAIVDECIDEEWLQPLAAHLRATSSGPGQRPRRYAMVRHLADLFDRYAVHRPELVL